MGKRKKGGGGANAGGKPKRQRGGQGSSARGPSQGANLSQGRDARRHSRRQARVSQHAVHKRAHDGEDVREDTRQRLRAKALQRRLDKLNPSAPKEERAAILREAGLLYAHTGAARQAIDALQKLLELLPEDPDFVRSDLLCLLLDQAKTQEASDLMKGPLFSSLLKPGVELEKEWTASRAARAAATTGLYSAALLTYISVRVLQEHRRNPNKAAEGEVRLLNRLRAAHRNNPFIAEFIAFAPAFQPHFPVGSDLPAADRIDLAEEQLLEGLDYCCKRSQVTVWLDTDDDVRRFVRCTLFEEEPEGAAGDNTEDQPPLGALPESTGSELILVPRWKKARQDALELWAEEMSTEGGPEGEGEEEEAVADGMEEEEEESEEEDEEGAMSRAEEAGGFGGPD